ncbi:ABC transporter ATP-binding protein [Paenibacillus sp. FSL H7-0942]|uniref:ABC transporter ATP-binding protein n=1 Tax=Paenibacillus amylolyticus TaxID=1451 RepID=A0ABD8B114_PAEAM|nr:MULTISPECIES: ABC transporter ATP-binding protein [Paenibacillus]OME95682.1 bacitracin ABC transporter ATP-binding protein [Paenibacillus amylolyticus]OMF00115.1 bacitracin ABC transporter ATP-binding protein [Paenibacillus amylolyticus]OMF40011.1 bacitracin ABC transporter ATP-binding protein [Paenibacillus amylolyticus]WFA88490.1 ABC transporter ATP-binding protein [Paenibacillus amylolyticus]
MNSSPIVETHNLSKSYGGTNRVHQVNLAVETGQIFGFLGPNGAGKTTTLKMLLGLIKPTEGTVKVFGKDLNKHRPSILNQTGSLIESPSYYGHLTGLENMKVMQRLRNVPNKNIDEALKIVRLENQKHKQADQYSLGMKQRLGIAMALLAFPSLLILDEPTNGLDPSGIGEIRELIKSLPGQYGITVLLSSHLLSEIEQIATSVGIISDGKLLFQGSMQSLQANNKATIRFQTTDTARAEKILLTQGYMPTVQGKQLVFDYLRDEEVSQMNKVLVQHDIPVIRIEEYKKSLEGIFLDLTGKERSL